MRAKYKNQIYIIILGVYYVQENATALNFSLLFWDDTGRSLDANISKPNFGTSRLELRPSNKFPGYRSLYILNDGRVNVF